MSRTLDLGCGANRDPSATDGMDVSPARGVTIQWDAGKFPWPIADGAYDRVVSHQLLEHLPPRYEGDRELMFVLFDEVHRILRPGGVFEFDTPHARSRQAHELSHRRYFNVESFRPFWDASVMRHAYARRKQWQLLSCRVERVWPFLWHVRRSFPRVGALYERIPGGPPGNIHVRLRRRSERACPRFAALGTDGITEG